MLEPYRKQVYIVANAHNHADLTAWASSSGLPAANVLNNGQSENAVHVAADIAFAIKAARLDDSHLVGFMPVKNLAL